MNRTSQRHAVRRVLLHAIAIMVFLLAGCAGSATVGPSTTLEPTVESSAPATVEPQLVAGNNLIPLHGCADGVMLVACSSPHDTQNYAVFDSPSNTYDPTALSQECYPYFLEFAGTPIAESGLSGESWYPQRSQWDEGNRAVQCLVLFDASVTASLPELDLAAGFAGRIPWSSLNAGSCVEAYSDFDLVSVQTTPCTGNEQIDILGLVDIDDADEQCQGLAADAGAEDRGLIERSWLLEARGFTRSICYSQLGEA